MAVVKAVVVRATVVVEMVRAAAGRAMEVVVRAGEVVARAGVGWGGGGGGGGGGRWGICARQLLINEWVVPAVS